MPDASTVIEILPVSSSITTHLNGCFSSRVKFLIKFMAFLPLYRVNGAKTTVYSEKVYSQRSANYYLNCSTKDENGRYLKLYIYRVKKNFWRVWLHLDLFMPLLKYVPLASGLLLYKPRQNPSSEGEARTVRLLAGTAWITTNRAVTPGTGCRDLSCPSRIVRTVQMDLFVALGAFRCINERVPGERLRPAAQQFAKRSRNSETRHEAHQDIPGPLHDALPLDIAEDTESPSWEIIHIVTLLMIWIICQGAQSSPPLTLVCNHWWIRTLVT